MTSIKQTNALFRRARRDDGRVVQKEAKGIVNTLQKQGVSDAELKAVSAQLKRNRDSFTSAARQTLTSLFQAPPRPGRPTVGSASAATAATPAAQAAQSLAASSGGTIEDRAAAVLGGLKEPAFPGENATEAQLAQFQKDLGKYNRTDEMMSKIMANSHEMKKAMIGNIPRA